MSRPDVLIVGAGAAGVSAALWCVTLDLGCVLLEREAQPGGQLMHVHFHPPDLAGLAPGDGPAIAARFAAQLGERGIVPHIAAPAMALEPRSDGRDPAVRIAGGERLTARAIVIATGVHRRLLGVPGEQAFEGRGVSHSATRDRAALAGRRVIVAGGGDAAFENAVLLARDGGEVTLLVRGRTRARAEFRDRAAASGVHVHQGVRVVAIHGDDRLREVEVQTAERRERLAADALVVKIGVEPDTAWCAGAGVLDAEGYVRAGHDQATPAPGVWAAGDVTRPPLASLAVALGQGALAIASIRRELRPD